MTRNIWPDVIDYFSVLIIFVLLYITKYNSMVLIICRQFIGGSYTIYGSIVGQFDSSCPATQYHVCTVKELNKTK
jgi:hypothetical protein